MAGSWLVIAADSFRQVPAGGVRTAAELGDDELWQTETGPRATAASSGEQREKLAGEVPDAAVDLVVAPGLLRKSVPALSGSGRPERMRSC